LNSNGIADALTSALSSAGKSWKQAKRHADREDRVRQSELNEMRRPSDYHNITSASDSVMEKAYLHASGNGHYPANARQIMYAARPLVIELAGKAWSDSAYFTQTLLPKFIEEHPDLTAEWDVIYDARGNLIEPHDGEQVPLGTLEVRDYISKWENSSGSVQMDLTESLSVPSALKFDNVLFVEKEGFHELLRQAQIPERFDVALMSTKGMTVVACRSLIEFLSQQGVRVLVAHDFDKAGFGIYHTMIGDSARFTYTTQPNVVELGLRLGDVRKMKLVSEPVDYRANPTDCLREYGCTNEEIEFLAPSNGYVVMGQRVELNAMSSPQFIEWLEKKFKEHGVEKFVPEKDVLHDAYIEAAKLAAVAEAREEALRQFQRGKVKVPANLEKILRKAIAKKPQSWDRALIELAEGAA
jgi:hypothetical protein